MFAVKGLAIAFLQGLSDSLSLHRTVPLLWNSRIIAAIVTRVMAANVIILIGSILIYSRGIKVALAALDSGGYSSALTSHLVFMLYHSLWLMPIWTLCYASSMAWYQELGDHTYKYLKGLPKDKSLKKSLVYGTYATILWFIIFVESIAFSSVMPPLVLRLLPLAEAAVGSNTVLLTLLYWGAHSGSYLLQTFGAVLTCGLYGWYGFDVLWIAADVSPDQRFAIMERHLPYFLGFGLPYLMINRATTFFYGYGLFLALFPFCIMSAGVADARRGYEAALKRAGGAAPPPIELYKPAKLVALTVLRLINDKYLQKTE